MVSYYWFQEEAINAVDHAWQHGKRSVMVSVPTGGGKTIIFSGVVDKKLKETSKRAMVLVHRDALLRQAEQKMKFVSPSLKIGKVISGCYEYDKQVTIASVQTLEGRMDEFLRACDRYGPIEFLITDECHHAIASTWANIYKGLEDYQPPLHLGVTATPVRTNKNEHLGDVFEDIVYSISIFQLIQEGFLTPLVALNIETTLNLNGIKETGGDYNSRDLSERIKSSNFNERVVDVWAEKAANRKCICFAVDVEHVNALVDAFNRKGARAVGIHGQIPKKQQTDILEGYDKDKFNILVNCELLTEGFDCTAIDSVIMARPTSSLGLYIQMVGRGLRLHPGKKDCLLLDFTDNCRKHKLITIQDLLAFYGLNKAHKHFSNNIDKGKPIEFTPETIKDIMAVDQFGDELATSPAFREVDVFDLNNFAWSELDGNWFVTVRNNLTLSVYKTGKDKYITYLISHSKDDRWKCPISDPVDYEFALAIANVYLYDYGDRRLAIEGAEWRDAEPSPEQVAALNRAFDSYKKQHQSTTFTPAKLTHKKGDYSKTLTALFGSRYISDSIATIDRETASEKLKNIVLSQLYNIDISKTHVDYDDIEIEMEGEFTVKDKETFKAIVSTLRTDKKRGDFPANFITRNPIIFAGNRVKIIHKNYPAYIIDRGGKSYMYLRDRIEPLFRSHFRDKHLDIVLKEGRRKGEAV